MHRTARTLALLATASLVLAVALPAHAGGKPVSREKYSDAFTFTETDLCGIEAQFDVTVSGTFKVMPVQGSDEAFLGYDSYRFTEIISTDAGWIRTEARGHFHEQTATQVDGDFWEFTFVDAGQFSVYDASGERLLRANGVFKATEQFDTLGDGQPGGVPVEGTFEVLHEAGRTITDEQFCAAVLEELT
jgi:hypothetical protein